MNTLFTIGHSNHEIATLVKLLRQHDVQVVADVRSHPFSARLPQFNRPLLERSLEECGLKYVFLGRELGARREEHQCYVNGQARYDLIASTSAFTEGLKRLRNGLGQYRLCLLCAEKDPLTCHRTILVCRHLRGLAFPIQHIHADGGLEPHEAAEERLLKLAGQEHPSLFASHHEQVEEAYEKQGLKIAYRESDSQPEDDFQPASVT
jgi:uncharacterized protein (DUF488 family)